MTTVIDKQKAQSWVKRQAKQIRHDVEHVDELASFLKYLNNLIDRVDPDNNVALNISDMKTMDDLILLYERLCEHVLDAGEHDQFTKTYKTSDLAKFMGVTVATVNNWIKDERIHGIVKTGKNAHAKIPESAIYLSSSNEPMTVKEIAELYYSEIENHKVQSPQEDEMLAAIKYFNNKYGGTYTETLANKQILTPQEQRDIIEWKYILKSLELLDE